MIHTVCPIRSKAEIPRVYFWSLLLAKRLLLVFILPSAGSLLLNLFKKNLCVRADGTDSSKYLGWTAELASLPTKQTSASRSQPMSARLGQPYCISQVGLSHKLECGGSEGILTERRGSRARRKKDEFHVSYPIQFRLQMRCRMERPQYDAKQRATISALRGWTGSCFCCGLTPRACSTRRILGNECGPK